ncbi:hypothetical protein NSA19_13710 [Actinomyces bowdenii]|uniref:hypothetical protein n=1 Tax=Actinomyces bowdenii TaxID=131109 RepID=UPI00214A8F38|nr:hypothetical protein [Actinomyces bowdenii]MCR2053870.1 hypothetical protein [Actinomyces bowdenii]
MSTSRKTNHTNSQHHTELLTKLSQYGIRATGEEGDPLTYNEAKEYASITLNLRDMAGFKQDRIPVCSWVEFSAGAV